NGCIETIRAAKAAGGDATYLLLPERGVPGNSHMLMMDRNNLAIADLLLGWLAERDLARAS
ncbi:MAG: hypothetical protein J0H62_10435, partial [Rhizobiales bacterium]|nr:hypothetical protein [Hyphomicrobiales bacterium]